MDATTQAYEQIMEHFVRWAQDEDGIRAACVIGSRARTSDHPADEWSDLDIIAVVRDPQPYLQDTSWVHHLGVPWLTFIEGAAGNNQVMEVRTLFEGGLDVDVAFLPLHAWQPTAGSSLVSDLPGIIQRGARVLLDKDGVMAPVAPATEQKRVSSPLSQAEFLNVVNDFWYHTVWTAKHLRRGELWWAKSCCDGYLKDRLRRMLEWHAQALQGAERDTWLRGRFLEEWADLRAVAQLREAFAHYDADDVWRALLVTMDIFRWLSLETAERLGYPYPTAGAQAAYDMTRRLHAERSD